MCGINERKEAKMKSKASGMLVTVLVLVAFYSIMQDL